MMEGEAGGSPVSLEPGVSSCYGHAWRHLWKYFLDLFLGLILLLAVTVPISFLISWYVAGYWPNLAVSYAFNFLIYGPIGFGWAYMTLRAARDKKVEIQHLFEGFRCYGHAVLANILMTIIVSIPALIAYLAFLSLPVLGILLFIPAVIFIIIFYCKLAFVPFLVVDKKLDALGAIKTSWNMTNYYSGVVFLIGLLGIPITIAGFICLIVGVIPAVMWIYVAIASLYYAVDMRRGMKVSPGDRTLPYGSSYPSG
jgi:hypothetical protein